MDDSNLDPAPNAASGSSSDAANSLGLDPSLDYPENVTLASLTTENPYLQGLLDASGNMLPQYKGSNLLPNVSPWENQFTDQNDPPYALPGGSSLYSNQTSLIPQEDYSPDALLNPDAYINSNLLHNNPYLQGTLDANGNLLPEYQSDAQRILSGVSLPATGQIPTTPNPSASAPNVDPYPTQYSVPTPATGYAGITDQSLSKLNNAGNALGEFVNGVGEGLYDIPAGFTEGAMTVGNAITHPIDQLYKPVTNIIQNYQQVPSAVYRLAQDAAGQYYNKLQTNEGKGKVLGNLAGLAVGGRLLSPENESSPSSPSSSTKIQFGQATISPVFGSGPLAGRSIQEIAAGLKAGTIHPDQLPLDIIQRNNVIYTLNNRSLMALRLAGTTPTVIKNKTGVPKLENKLSERLNEIGNQAGSDFIPTIDQ